MCRIFGNIVRNGQALERDLFLRLTLLSRKGGPDNTSVLEEGPCQFGFNRLAILDTSDNGNQPLVSPSGRFVMVFNGEVYNFRELIREYGLQALRSGSDSEVISQLLDRIPFETLATRLNGMFAIAVWDKSAKCLYLLRDFAGIKPLFYGRNDQGLVFSSAFDQIILHPWFQHWSWSEQGVMDYHEFGYMVPPRTIANDIWQLPVGHFLRYVPEADELVIKPYQLFFGAELKPEKAETDPVLIEEVHTTLKQIIRDQLVSDVPLGVFLSGGIDSSLVSAIASRIRPDIQTLTIGFEDKEYDESSKAAEYAKILGVQNNRMMLSASEMLNIFEEHCQSLTEPLADYSSLPTYMVSKLAAQKYKVMLSGDGGDELFWGYPRFATYANSAGYFQIPGSTTRQVVKRVAKSLGQDITGLLGMRNIGEVNRTFHQSIVSSVLSGIFPGSSTASDILSDFHCTETKRASVLQYLRQNEFYYHLQKILVKVDRTSMGNSLEVRVPFLDRQMLLLAQQIAPKLTIDHDTLKYVLRQILYTYIPETVVEKAKKGFRPPMTEWARTVLKQEISDILRTDVGLPSDRYDQKAALAYADDFFAGRHGYIMPVWTMYMFKKWHLITKNRL
jgi:asparagine synthase (glutamine-hydrolysing)